MLSRTPSFLLPLRQRSCQILLGCEALPDRVFCDIPIGDEGKVGVMSYAIKKVSKLVNRKEDYAIRQLNPGIEECEDDRKGPDLFAGKTFSRFRVSNKSHGC